MLVFIIPSIARKTLVNTLSSIYEIVAERDEWRMVICFDNVLPCCSSGGNVLCIKTDKKLCVGHNGAGEVRNYAMQSAIDKFNLQDDSWFFFVDDDDSLCSNYIIAVKEAIAESNPDIIIFKMKYTNGSTLPPDGIKDIMLLENRVGISFGIKKRVFDQLKFTPSSGEDYQFLKRAVEMGYSIHVSNRVTYNVAPLGIAEDRR